eukprot:m.789771 g.789771  ORF g.789771 m.789771 type:complete len:160 (-) comp59198_c0_seq2:1234-1713(-)
MPNINLATHEIKSHFAKIDQSGNGQLVHYESYEFSILCNLLASQGQPGKVIRVRASHRTAETNFVSCMRAAVKAHYGDKPVGIGGAFLIRTGKAKIHIMPDFSSTPLLSDAEVNQWLRFFHYDAPLVCLSTFVSHDPVIIRRALLIAFCLEFFVSISST